MTTWMIEGEWSGPSDPAGDWNRLVHREYTTSQQRADACREMGSILYSDGTRLLLHVSVHHGCRHGSRNGYGDLIPDCIRHGVKSVEDLPDVEVSP